MTTYLVGVIITLGIYLANVKEWKKTDVIVANVIFCLIFLGSSWLGVGYYIGTLGKEEN